MRKAKPRERIAFLDTIKHRNDQKNIMKRISLAISLLVFHVISTGCQRVALNPEKDDDPEIKREALENFVKVTSDGTYTYMATSSNVAGGEAVSIPEEYYIGIYAVTNQDWKIYLEETGKDAPKYWKDGTFPSGRRKHPVLWVSYLDAEEYCVWLGKRTEGWTFRLPTQAEWEYAASGSRGTDYPWGKDSNVTYNGNTLTSDFNYNAVIAAQVLSVPDRMATYNHPQSARYGQQDKISDIISVSASGGVKGWVDHKSHLGFIYTDIFSEINDKGGNTCEVDAYPEGKSWCGCYNMCGNCWEWTSTVEIAMNGAEKGEPVNVIRGGSWYANASSCKVSFRGEGRKATSAYNTVGFRIVAEKDNN